MVKKRTITIIGTAVPVILLVVGVGLFMALRPHPFIPPAISKQLTSTVFIPNDKQYVLNPQSVKYDATNKLLTYSASMYGAPCVITIQPTPQQFIDVSQSYDLFIAQSSGYDSFDSVNGKVNLIQPKGIVNAAVMQAKGSLMFVKCDSKLSGTQWRQIFNTLNIVK